MTATKTLDETAIEFERARRNARRVLDAEEQGDHPPLVALPIRDLFNRPSPGYIVDQWIPEGALVQTVAAPGRLKTFFNIAIGLSVAAKKKEFFGYSIVKHGAVLYVAAEGMGALQFRIRAWCHEHGVDPLQIPFCVIPAAVNLRDPALQKELLAIVEKMQPLLIFVDTFSRCIPGADENSARDVGEAISFFSDLQKVSHATIAVVHHPPKNDPTGGGRGSGVMYGAVDTEIRIEADGEDEDVQVERPITVTCVKQKDDLRPPKLDLIGCVVPVRDLDGREMAHASGRAITSLVLRLVDGLDAAGKAETKLAAANHEIDLKVLRVMNDSPNATSQQRIRLYAGLKLDVVTASVGRILQKKWAIEGKRGEPFTITEAGREALETPF